MKHLLSEPRLTDLYSYDILDSDEEKEFNDLVNLASFICDCPISLITFVDQDRQWFKAKKNMPYDETPIESFSFCATAITENQVFVVEDALQDEVFSNYKIVTDDIKIRFYAGSPIQSSSGNNLGTICVIDTKPRKLSVQQLDALNTLSRQASKLLELRVLNKKLSQKSTRLVKSIESYRDFFDEAPIPLWIYDFRKDEFIAVNTAVEQLYGYTKQEFSNISLFNILKPSDHDISPVLQQLDDVGKMNIIGSHIKKDGTEVVVDVTLTKIDYDGCNVIMATMIDLSEKLNLKEKLVEEKTKTSKKIEKATLYAQSQEREYLGRELHDNINQMLAGIKLYLDVAYSDDKQRLSLIDQSKKYLTTTINEVRNLSHRLVDVNTKGLNLVEAIEELLEPYVLSNSYEIDLDIRCNVNNFAADVKITILRILQETVQNIEKYAQANKITICISCENNHIELTVIDNGKGFDFKYIKPGIGLTNILERTKKLQGRAEVTSTIGVGTTVEVKIPVNN